MEDLLYEKVESGDVTQTTEGRMDDTTELRTITPGHRYFNKPDLTSPTISPLPGVPESRSPKGDRGGDNI